MIKETLVLAIVSATFFMVMLMLLGQKEPGYDYTKLEKTELHSVACITEQGLETYHIVIPDIVKNVAKFKQGFCESL